MNRQHLEHILLIRETLIAGQELGFTAPHFSGKAPANDLSATPLSSLFCRRRQTRIFLSGKNLEAGRYFYTNSHLSVTSLTVLRPISRLTLLLLRLRLYPAESFDFKASAPHLPSLSTVFHPSLLNSIFSSPQRETRKNDFNNASSWYTPHINLPILLTINKTQISKTEPAQPQHFI
jgi:hypothetical protein